MELLEAIRSRRTIRRYQDRDVPRQDIERLIALSTHAPSACNRRMWRFILVEQSRDFQWLYENGSASFVKDLRQAILVCYSSRNDNREWHDAEQSASAAISYFQLLAHAEGIGSCWICHLPPKREVSRYFSIPASYSPMALVSFGYYVPGASAAERIVDRTDLISLSRWDFPPQGESFFEVTRFQLRRLARRVYYLFPCRKFLRKYAARYEKTFPDDM